MNMKELIVGINAGTVDTLDGLVSGVLDGPVTIDGGGKRIGLLGIERLEPSKKITYCSPGAVEIDCRGNSLTIKNLEIWLCAKKLGFVSGLVIKNAVGLVLESVAINGSSLTGIDLRSCKDVEVTDCYALANMYAGITLSGCSNALIKDCKLVNNGETIPMNGYGIALQGGPGNVVNTDVLILNSTAIGNKRKGIDVHCGRGVRIEGNYVRNIGDMGIYAVSESPAKNVGYVEIINNTIQNEANSGLALSCSGIAVGSSNDGNSLPPDSGDFRVDGNIITSDPRNLGVAGIQVYMPRTGPAPAAVSMVNNVIYQRGVPQKNYGIIVQNREPPLGSQAGYQLPEIGHLDIRDNIVTCLGESGAGILASHGRNITITKNLVSCDRAVYGIASQGAEKLTESDNVVTGKFSRAALYCNERKRG